MKRTAIYLRVSTDKQAKEGDSIPAQRDALMRYISDHKALIFAGEYLDDGISGTKADRTEYQRLLTDVENGKVDLVICTKLDRLHRGLKNFLNMQDVFDKAGCTWLAIWEPIYDSSTPQGKMIINTMVNLAQFEAEQTGQRIRQVMEYKRNRGECLNNSAPFGMRIENKCLVLSEDAPKAKMIFEHYANTSSVIDTRRYAASLGYDVSRHMIRNMLHNRRYAGTIVGKELFENVQAKLAKNIKSNSKRIYIFSGLIVCGECGSKCSGMTASGKSYYRCQKHCNQKCINATTISEGKLEKQLVDSLPELVENHIIEYERKHTEITDVSKEISTLKRKIDKLKELYVNDLIDMSEYKRDKEQYMRQIEELSAIATEEPKDIAPLRKIVSNGVSELYWQWGKEQKRTYWRDLIDRITIDKSRNISVYFLE